MNMLLSVSLNQVFVGVIAVLLEAGGETGM